MTAITDFAPESVLSRMSVESVLDTHTYTYSTPESVLSRVSVESVIDGVFLFIYMF
jgi:hypothetical protein